MKYTFVTIVFAGELDLHRLQARSLARYLSSDMVAQIIVIENSMMPKKWRAAMRQHYGPLEHLVTTISADQIAVIPSTSGWFSQQILKLMISHHIATERYIVLDAKNHLVFPLQQYHLEKDGKILCFAQHYENHPLRSYLDHAAAYFAVQPDITRFLPTTTPFVLPTQSVVHLIDHIRHREGNFENFFIQHHMTEFFLFTVYLLSIGQLDLYDLSGLNCTIVWKEKAADNRWIKREIVETERHERPFFAIHRGSLPLLTPVGQQIIAEFWVRRHLFPAVSEALHTLSVP